MSTPAVCRVLPTIRRHGRFDPFQIGAPNHNVYIPGGTSSIGRGLFHVKVRGKSADNSIIDPGLREGLVDKMRQVEQLFHAVLEECVYVYGTAAQIISRPMRQNRTNARAGIPNNT